MKADWGHSLIFKETHCFPLQLASCMCTGDPDSHFWLWCWHSALSAFLENPWSACGELPHRNGLVGTGQVGPENINEVQKLLLTPLA